jgi:type II secretory pathway pseudopilin PulG
MCGGKMKTHRLQFGLTLVEILVAGAFVAVLAGIVLTTLTRIDSQSKEHLCLGTLETLNTALRQFRDYGYEYKIRSAATNSEIDFYRSLKFPPDCNDYSEIQTENEITILMNLSLPADISDATSEQYDPCDSGSAVMYFFLSQVPQCRETLAGIDPSLLKNDHKNNKNYWTIDIAANRSYPWLRVVDPWGTPLRYDYCDETKVLLNTSTGYRNAKDTIRSFPLITSAGPDEIFGTSDDITNRDKTKGAEYQP